MEYEIHEFLDGAIRITYARTTFLLMLFVVLMAKGTKYAVYKIEGGQAIYLFDRVR